MDISQMMEQAFIQLLTNFWYIPVLMVLLAIIKTNWWKGVWGEFQVNMMLKRLPKTEYNCLKDITLPTTDGTTQIDHIVISRFGIFVIETKNIKGWIFGSANQAMWTQQIYRHRNQFQNPLRQNYKHTQTLAQLLELPNDVIFSVIVFIGDSTFKTTMPDNVTYASACLSYIRAQTEQVLTLEQVAQITTAIADKRLTANIKTHMQHVKHVKTIKAAKLEPSLKPVPPIKIKQQQDIEQKEPVVTMSKTDMAPQCSQCGSTMVLRTAKRGSNVGNQFWGCSNYPRCKKMLPVATD